MTGKKQSLAQKVKEAKTTEPPHVMIIARAGTGKTTTLIEGLKHIKGQKVDIIPSPQQKLIWDQMESSKEAQSICICSFSNTIVNTLKARVPEKVEARTLSSLGYQSVRGSFQLLPGDKAINQNRVDGFLEKITGKDLRELRRDYPIQTASTLKLVKLVKMNLLTGEDHDALDDLVDAFEIDLVESRAKIYAMIPKILAMCKLVARDKQIDYDDQLWLPVVLNLPVPRFDLLLVDEVQDCNRAQQELAARMGRRLILCGDPAQAIYQFAGADSISMSRMENRLQETKQGCVTLKLTVTRRCGKSIVKEAQHYVPDFEAHESNPEGEVTTMKLVPEMVTGSNMKTGSIGDVMNKAMKKTVGEDYRSHVQDGDLILCRANAPLVSEVFKFIRQGRKAIVRGRDIGDGLIKLINKLEKRKTASPGLAGLLESLEAWATQEVATEMAKKFPSDFKIQSVGDKQACLETLCDEVETVGELRQKIVAIFSDESTTGITLSSVHRAKGTESKVVFWIIIPRRPNLIASQAEAERNIDYVATTRAISKLVKVISPDKEKPKPW